MLLQYTVNEIRKEIEAFAEPTKSKIEWLCDEAVRLDLISSMLAHEFNPLRLTEKETGRKIRSVDMHERVFSF